MIKKHIKKIAAFAFVKSRLSQSVRYAHKKRLIILCYHRVSAPGEEALISNKNMCASREAFQAQMKFLKEQYCVVGEREIAASLEAGSDLPDYAAWVTFDDGYKDNYVNAYPVLKDLNIPATFFVTTGFINRVAVPAEDACSCGGREPADLFMSWDEVKDLKRNGYSIGGHTRTHKILTSISVAECKKEINESKQEIEAQLNERIYSFAYPHGRPADIDFSVHPQLLDACGFKIAVTTIGGGNYRPLSDTRLTLRRICFSFDDDVNVFQAKVDTGCFWQKY